MHLPNAGRRADTEPVGYEVLDTDGGQVQLPQGSVPPTDVVNLTDLPEPEPAAQSGEGAGRTPWARFDPPTAWKGRTSTGWVAAMLSVALLAGAIAGGLWSHHHSTLQQDAELAGRLSVVAIVTNVDAVRAQRIADFTVKVVNAGPLPLELVTSPPGQRATTDRPVVRALGGAVTVPAGGSLSANVRVGVDCSSSANPMDAVRIPLRTSDGEVHQVEVAEQSNLDSGYSAPSPCSSPDDPALEARLAGSIAQPQLLLHNTSDSYTPCRWTSSTRRSSPRAPTSRCSS